MKTKSIFLSWQGGEHQERLIIGVLIKALGGYSFHYLPGKDLDRAKELGFKGYPAFPNFDQEYSKNVIETFEMRLPSPEREDFQKLLERWDIRDANLSSFDLLAITGGQLPTDFFEFIDPHDENPPTEFLTELAGFTHYVDDQYLRTMTIGTELYLEREPENPYDTYAIKVYLSSKQLGYIKKIHAQSISKFMEKEYKISITVTRISANGIVSSVILRVRIQ